MKIEWHSLIQKGNKFKRMDKYKKRWTSTMDCGIVNTHYRLVRFPPLVDPSTELLLGFVSASKESFRFSAHWKWEERENYYYYVDGSILWFVIPVALLLLRTRILMRHTHGMHFVLFDRNTMLLLELNGGTRSSLTVAGDSMVTLSWEIAPGVVTTGDVPTYAEPSIFAIWIPNCGSQWFLNTFSASSSLSSIRVPCKIMETIQIVIDWFVRSA